MALFDACSECAEYVGLASGKCNSDDARGVLVQLALNIEGARKALGNIGRSTVYRLIATGELEIRKVFGRTLITARSIRRKLGLDTKEPPKAA